MAGGIQTIRAMMEMYAYKLVLSISVCEVGKKIRTKKKRIVKRKSLERVM